MADELYRYNKHGQRQILLGCVDCGKERWVVLYKGIPEHQRCQKCENKRRDKNGSKNHAWKGGRVIGRDGYISVKIEMNHPFLSMANSNRYIKEHRLVMAQHLGRALNKNEWVHHLNGNKKDNNLGNLILVKADSHPVAYREAYMDGYKQGYKDGTKNKGNLS